MKTIKDPSFRYVGNYCEFIWDKKYHLFNEPVGPYKAYFMLKKTLDYIYFSFLEDIYDNYEKDLNEFLSTPLKPHRMPRTFIELQSIKIINEPKNSRHPSSFIDKSKCDWYIDQEDLKQFYQGKTYDKYTNQWVWF